MRTVTIMGEQFEIDITKIPCIRCKGRGVHEDKMNFDGGIIECGLCGVNGYVAKSFDPGFSDEHLEIL